MKVSHEKSEIAGMGILKSVKVAVCGMKHIDLCNYAIKIAAIHFSGNEEKWNQKFFIESITKIQNVLEVWLMHCLTLEGKIVVFKTLAISNIVFPSLISNIPTEVISELERIQKLFCGLLNQK